MHSSSSCPFCNQPFKSAGALSNHLEKQHPGQDYRSKRRRTNGASVTRDEPYASSSSTDARGNLGFEEFLQQYSSEAFNFTPNVRDTPQELQEEISYSGDNLDSQSEDDAQLQTNEPTEVVTSFPVENQAGKALSVAPFVKERQPLYNFFHPFQNALYYKLARFFFSAHVPKARIDDFFRDNFFGQQTDTAGSIPPTFSFRSSHTLYQRIDDMIVDPPWKNGFVNFRLVQNTEFWYRDILEVLKYLLRRKSFAGHMLWAPVKQFDTQQERVYTEMNTASWWWDTQMSLPVGATLVPVLFASDATHLTNFSGDGKLWPLYMSIGNIKSSIRNRPTSYAWVPVAILPIGPKRIKKVAGWSEENQEQEANQILHDLLTYILRPLSNTSKDGVPIKCSDEVTRSCHFRVTCWLADHMENAMIHAIYATRCPICESPQYRLGDLEKHPLRNSEQYQAWFNASDTESLHSNGVKPVKSAVWSLRDVVGRDLIRPDILHTLLLGNLQHLMDWIKGFLETHNRLPVFDNIWGTLPQYPGNHVPSKPYRLLTQLSGNEMRSILVIILGVFTATLRRVTNAPRPTGGQEQEFRKAITCVRYLTDFALLSRYRSHTDSTIGYMREYLERFHATKDIFLRYRAGKAAKAKADIVSKELTAQNNIRNFEANANGRTAAQKARAAAEDKQERAFLVNQALVEGSHFNFPKVHLMMHWADQISRYGSLPQYSTEICETSHKLLKDAYRRSNHVDSVPQIIKGYSRSLSFAVRELEMAAWALEDPAIKERVGDVVRPPRNLKDRQLIVPDGTKIFMTLRGKRSVNEIYNLSHIAEEYSIPGLDTLMQQFFEQNVCQTADNPQSDARKILSGGAVRAYNTLEIPVSDQDVDDNNIYKVQCLRATGRKLWRGKEPRRDTVWVRIQSRGSRQTSVSERVKCYRGRVIGFLNGLFTFRGTNQELYRLAHVTLLDWVGSPTPHGPEGMSYVQESTAGGRQRIIWLCEIEGAAHLIPLEPVRKWIVNNRIDYNVWNEMNDE